MDHSLKKTALLSLVLLLTSCSANFAPVSSHTQRTASNPSDKTTQPSGSSFICHDAQYYKNQVVGSGECVDLIKLCSGAPHTSKWMPGRLVLGQNILPGTAIATFKNGKYPNKTGYHAAIYSHQTNDGIYVWDQWQGKAVHQRLIRANQQYKKNSNNANKYRVITKR